MVSTYTISLVRLSPKRGRMGLLVPFNRWVTLRVTGPQKQSWHPRLLAEVRVFLALSSARITTRTQAFFFWYKWVNSHVNGLSCLPLFQGRFAKIKASYNHQRLQATKDDKANTWVLINLEVSFNQSTVLPELNLIKKKNPNPYRLYTGGKMPLTSYFIQTPAVDFPICCFESNNHVYMN